MTAVIVFDLDDTLYPETDFVRSGFRAVDAYLSAQCGVTGFFAEAWREFEEGRRGNIFDAALSKLGVVATPELIRSLVDAYRAHSPNIELYPDASQVLARRADFLGFAILTDGYEATQQRKIQALGLSNYCDLVVTTDSWGVDYWKPNPLGFMFIQNYFGLPGSSCIYIADNPNKDFIAPRKLGWGTIRIKRSDGLHSHVQTDPAYEAALTIKSLDELVDNYMHKSWNRE